MLTTLAALSAVSHTAGDADVRRHEERTDDDRIEARVAGVRAHAAARNARTSPKQLDFHQIVAAMGSYPTLLRRLGLVVDLMPGRRRPSRWPAAATVGQGRVSRGRPAGAAHRRCRTGDTHAPHRDAVRRRAGTGREDADQGRPARSRSGAVTVLQLDVDGAGLKLMNFARSLGAVGREARVDPVTRHEDEIGAPALQDRPA